MSCSSANHEQSASRTPAQACALTDQGCVAQGACSAKAVAVLCAVLHVEAGCSLHEACAAAQVVLRTMCHILSFVHRWGGTTLCCTGECVLATWSAAAGVESCADGVRSAVQCAEQVVSALIAPTQTAGLRGGVVVHYGHCVHGTISADGSDCASAEGRLALVGHVLPEAVSLAWRCDVLCVLISETARDVLSDTSYIFLPLGLTDMAVCDVDGKAGAAQAPPRPPALYALCSGASSLSSPAFMRGYNEVIDLLRRGGEAEVRRAMLGVHEHAVTAPQRSLLAHLERLVRPVTADGGGGDVSAASATELTTPSPADSLSSRGQTEHAADELTSFQRELHAKVRDLTASCTELASLTARSLAAPRPTTAADDSLADEALDAGAPRPRNDASAQPAAPERTASEAAGADRPACAQQLPLHRASSGEQLAGRVGDLSFAHSSALSGLEANSVSHLSYLCQPIHCSVTAATTTASSSSSYPAPAHHTTGGGDSSAHNPPTTAATSATAASPAARTTSARQPTTLATEVRGKNGVCYLRSDRLLGKGSYGEVYLGMESGCGRLVAIKYLPIPVDEKELSGIESEVTIMQRVKDAHVVEFITYAFQEDKIVFVLECMMAGSLQRLIAEFHTIPRATARVFLRDILQGLARLHGMDVVHRDVKPQNVLLTLSGTCKLSDFGASALIPQLARKENEGHVMGTPVYLAPEAARGKPVKASDVWSCGIVFLQAVTGRLPYTAEQLRLPAALLVFQIGSGSAVPCLPETLDTQEVAFVTSCLQSDPSQRKTAEELLRLPLFTT